MVVYYFIAFIHAVVWSSQLNVHMYMYNVLQPKVLPDPFVVSIELLGFFGKHTDQMIICALGWIYSMKRESSQLTKDLTVCYVYVQGACCTL